MKREKVIKKLARKGVRVAKDIPNAELIRKAMEARKDPSITPPPYRPLPPICTVKPRTIGCPVQPGKTAPHALFLR